MSKINNFIFFCFCLFIPFENTQLSFVGGVLTASPSFFFLLIGLILTVIIKTPKIHRTTLVCIIISLLVSFGYFFYWVSIYPTLDDYIFDRGIRFFVIISFYFGAIYYSMHQSKTMMIIGAKTIAFVIFLSLILQFLMPSLFYTENIFHFDEYNEFRMRGFAFEASSFGYQIICATLLLSCINNNINLFLSICLSISLGIITSSKGAIIVILLSLLIVFLLMKKINILFKFILFVICSILSVIIFNLLLLGSFLDDIEYFTSVATRTTVFLLGLKSLIYYPLGVGFFGFFTVFYLHGPELVLTIKQISPFPLNFEEVETYFQVGNYKSVGTKSTIIDLIIFFGWLFLIPFYRFISKNIKILISYEKYTLLLLGLFVLLSNLFFISSLTLYLTPFLIGFITCMNGEVQK